MGDLIIPGCDQLKFGNFDNVEIRRLSCLYFNDNSSSMINEYGSNMERSKMDPLVAIEAKNAICKGKSSEIFQFDYLQGKDGMSSGVKGGNSVILESIREEQENVVDARAISLSPQKDSQEPPAFSSQEDWSQKNTQEAEMTYMHKTKTFGELDVQLLAQDNFPGDPQNVVSASQEVCSKKSTQEEVLSMIQEKKGAGVQFGLGNTQEGSMESETSISKVSEINSIEGNSEAGQVPHSEAGQEWHQVRQSKRLRGKEDMLMKMNEINLLAEHQDSLSEGTITANQNSFAVLSHLNIVNLAINMGVQPDSLSFEKIDVLRDLENAGVGV